MQLNNLLISKGVSANKLYNEPMPELFNNPFSYVPHPLVEMAANKVVDFLDFETTAYLRNGLRRDGKMFGVLIVQKPNGETGFLAAYYGLNMLGLKSAHNLKDGSALVAASYCITAAATLALKKVIDEKRPNGKDYDAFTSGHAAISFMGAELLRLEYKDSAPWAGYAGYAAATYTSLARIRHSEHWFHDLVAGAGVGILGTRLAYWICPPVHKCLFGKSAEKHKNGPYFVGMPIYNGSVKGVSLAMVF